MRLMCSAHGEGTCVLRQLFLQCSPQWHPMSLDHWANRCEDDHIDTKEQPPVVSILAVYPHCPLYARKFKERTIEILGPLLHEMRIISAFNGNHHE